MILTLSLVVSGCLPVTLLSFADGIYKNYKLDVLETKIDKLEQNNKDVLPQKVEKPKEEPEEEIVDLWTDFKKNYPAFIWPEDKLINK